MAALDKKTGKTIWTSDLKNEPPSYVSPILVEDKGVRQSKLHVIAIDPDEKKVAALRRALDAAGLYGTRVAVHQGTPAEFGLPPYIASLVVSENLEAAGLNAGSRFIGTVFNSLRPYGGVACLPGSEQAYAAFGRQVAAAGLPNATVERKATLTLLRRVGPLPGAVNWSHLGSDAGNTFASRDDLVKAPLGVLWFGGPAGGSIFFHRHYWPPSALVVGGRMLVQGPGMLHAVDVYTGRLLWKAKLPMSMPTKTSRTAGFEYAAAEDGIYVICGGVCLRIDPATGKTLCEFDLPHGGAPRAFPSKFGLTFPAVCGPVVSGSALILRLGDHVVALDRHAGKTLWEHKAKVQLPLAAGGGKVFCMEVRPAPVTDPPKTDAPKTGTPPKGKPKPPLSHSRVVALSLADGKPLWSKELACPPGWLSYSTECDTLLFGGGAKRSATLIAYRGSDGRLLWKQRVRSRRPLMVSGRLLITQSGAAYDLLTGKARTKPNPLTGAPMPWGYKRAYGCNYAVAGKHLLAFRSGMAGYYDLANHGGTGNLGGFRSGCRNSLLPANGVLCAPKFAHLCGCAYPIWTSLGLVHRPDVEMWTRNDFKPAPESIIRRVGINFGAPGDRRAANGTLWLDCPSVGGPSPKVPIALLPAKPARFRHHSAWVQGGAGPKWVAASGVQGLESVTIKLADKSAEERAYTVRLHFIEPRHPAPGNRVFSVAVQGKEVLTGFDVVREAKGRNRAVVREFKGIQVKDDLVLTFPSKAGTPLICGIEVLAEG